MEFMDQARDHAAHLPLGKRAEFLHTAKRWGVLSLREIQTEVTAAQVRSDSLLGDLLALQVMIETTRTEAVASPQERERLAAEHLGAGAQSDLDVVDGDATADPKLMAFEETFRLEDERRDRDRRLVQLEVERNDLRQREHADPLRVRERLAVVESEIAALRKAPAPPSQQELERRFQVEAEAELRRTGEL